MASASTVRSYVYGLISIFPGVLQTPARWVADRVFSIWDEIFQFLVMMRSPFVYALDRCYRYVNAFWRFVNECATTVRWLVTAFVPTWARWGMNTAIDWARGQLAAARAALEHGIANVQAWAQNVINAVKNDLRIANQWAIDRVRELVDGLNAVRKRVTELLSSPSTFVDWVFAAMWARFWRFLNDHAESIGRTYWGRRDTILVAAMTRLETFLMKVL